MKSCTLRISLDFSLLALLGLAGCSADPGNVSLDASDEAALEADEVVIEERVATPEEVALEYTRAREGSLSSVEREAILGFLTERGVNGDDVSFSGRMVVQEGDMNSYADDLLALIDTGVEKGRVFDDINNVNAFPFCVSPLPACPLIPIDIANPSGSNLSFRRPDTSIKYYLVAPSGAPSYFVSALGLAASRITGVQTSPTDCLNGSNALFEAITIASYNLLPQATRDAAYAVTFVTGTFEATCGSGAVVGCASGPRLGNVKVNGVTQSRLRFGHIIAFGGVSPQGTATDGIVNDSGDEAVGIIIHEILHSMGLAHTKDSAAAVVPGTQLSSGADQSSSIMVANGNIDEPGWKDWSSAANTPVLDKTMLQKLYGNGSVPSSCGYNTSFRTISP